jgi:glycosyltransferase involved in cell wall biosynthesis
MMPRKNGISTLIACQNEEVTVGWAILSFLPFSDEIIVVDNGSTDKTKEIALTIAKQFPEKVRFFDVPHLKDLYENRQFAFEQSRFRWIVRGDADYICYTEGEYDCRKLRSYLLNRTWLNRPLVINLRQPSVHCDFFHTAAARVPDHERWPMAFWKVDPPMGRIYHWLPGMRFVRRGKWEGVHYPKALRRLIRHLTWANPVWMHCNIKSDSNYFFRSERTNWRELGDFSKYPSLTSYVSEVANRKYGTSDLHDAASAYVAKHVLPQLEPYNPDLHYPYPSFVRQAMESSPGYQIVTEDGRRSRRYLGINSKAFESLAHVAECSDK